MLYIQEERDHFPFSVISSIYMQTEETRSVCFMFYFFTILEEKIIVHLHETNGQVFKSSMHINLM